MLLWVVQRRQLTIASNMLDFLNLWHQYPVQLLFRIVPLGLAI